jgi:hypothetical protein
VRVHGGPYEEISMIKNLILLAVAVAWVSSSYAKTPVVQEDMKDVESFKVEKPEQERKREVAGIKKKQVEKTESTDESEDSEVRYWQYSE